jgi:hypothetical protein
MTPDNPDPRPLPIGPNIGGSSQAPTNQPPLPAGPPTEETWGKSVSSWQGCGSCGGLPCSPLPCDDAVGGSCGDACGTSWCRSLLNLCQKGISNLGSCFSPSCDAGCGNNCQPTKRSVWFNTEYLLWTVKSLGIPPLVTVNTKGNVPVLGVDGTAIAYGGDSVDNNLRSGGRFTLGVGLPFLGNTSFETTYFFLGTRNQTAFFDSNGTPALGRPYTSTGTFDTGFGGNQSAEIVAITTPMLSVAGRVTVTTSNELWGMEANFRNPLCCNCCWNLDLLWGFRYVQLTEDLAITEDLRSITMGGVPVGPGGASSIQVFDHFHTRNEFFGGQVGLDGEYRWRRWFVGATAKLGIGTVHQVAVINGETVVNGGVLSGVQSGGLLAQPTNIGRYGRDTFALVPELGLKVGYNFTDRLRGYIGYDVLYMSSVVRPGDIVDTNVNPNFIPPRGSGPIPGPALPRFQFRTNDFWAQGVNFGLQWSY